MTYDRYSDYRVDGRISASRQATEAGDVPVLGLNKRIPSALLEGGELNFSLQFDPAVFTTDPTGCLTYSGDAAGSIPISNLNNDLEIGSFDFKTNPLTRDCFYATIAGNGDILSVLDPYDLSKDTVGNDVSQEIQDENVMFIIPTRYSKRNANGISISTDPKNGTAYAHTFNGHVYKYLALGVYEGAIVSGKLKSSSGKEPTTNTTRPNFRTAAQANGTGWHLVNWHEWQLYRDTVLFGLKSFDSQRRLGQGNSRGNSTTPTVTLSSGMLDAAGPYAGMVGTDDLNTTSPVKFLIENPWSNRWMFLDDFVVSQGYEESGAYLADVYAGQALTPTDLTTDKVKIGSVPLQNITASHNNWCTQIQTDEAGWGLWNNWSGSDSTGLCDKHWANGTPPDLRLGLVGGSSYDGSYCGLSALYLGNALGHSAWLTGARLAFAFD